MFPHLLHQILFGYQEPQGTCRFWEALVTSVSYLALHAILIAASLGSKELRSCFVKYPKTLILDKHVQTSDESVSYGRLQNNFISSKDNSIVHRNIK